MRQVVLDTETTGLEPNMGHRVIEVGAVEMVNRKLTGRHFHEYINPERPIDDGAQEVHGITTEFLADKPLFSQIAPALVDFIRDADLVIHNAAFDVSFLNYEFGLLSQDMPQVEQICKITDSLLLARQKHPGQKNNLDALCRRYMVDNSQRELHGALLDAEILADVYLLMTGGQTSLFAGGQKTGESRDNGDQRRSLADIDLPLVKAADREVQEHEAYLDFLERKLGEQPIWRRA